MGIFSIFELMLWLSIPVQTFVVIGPQTTKIIGGGGGAASTTPKPKDVKKAQSD